MLGNKDVAGMIARVSCAMMIYAVLQIVRILRARQAATGQRQEK